MPLLNIKNLPKQKLNISKFILILLISSIILTDKICATDTTRGNTIGDFYKLVIHTNSRVIDLDHPLGMGTVFKLYLGSDTHEVSGETIEKIREEKKIDFELLDY